MRLRGLSVLSLLWLPPALLVLAGGTGWAQSGTLQVPSHPPRDQPEKPPSPAPRQPVHQTRGAAAAAPPVVAAHGVTHPQRPPGKLHSAGPAAGKTPTAPATSPAPAASPAPVAAAQPADDAKPAAEAEKPDAAARLPRFASLRSDDVNMRLGPGTRYRIEWVYKRRDLPVEIEREYDVWRWVADADGIHGWVHQATLMGRRTFIVQSAEATLRSDATDTAAAVAILKPGVIGRIRSCDAASAWCNVQAGSYRGYLRREQFWGVLPGEAVAP